MDLCASPFTPHPSHYATQFPFLFSLLHRLLSLPSTNVSLSLPSINDDEQQITNNKQKQTFNAIDDCSGMFTFIMSFHHLQSHFYRFIFLSYPPVFFSHRFLILNHSRLWEAFLATGYPNYLLIFKKN